MTNTPMSEREKELVPLVREALGALRDGTNWSLANDLEKALRAYGPTKETVPVIPAWEEFVAGKSTGNAASTRGRSEPYVNLNIEGEWLRVHMDSYNAIREALSKPKAPTE